MEKQPVILRKARINHCLLFIAFLMLCYNCKPTENPKLVIKESTSSYWTQEKQDSFASRNVDASKWDMEVLAWDMKAVKSRTWPSKPAISEIPSPVAKYNSPGGTLRKINLDLKDKHVFGYAVGWGKGDFNKHLFGESQGKRLVRVYFNILILVDDPTAELRAGQIISRNHPHYLSTGSQKTIIGKVDWLQTALANDDNYVVVNQRIFDLNYGRTLLVAPHKDGTLRFLQVKSVNLLDEAFQNYLDDLSKREDVLEFFTNDDVIDAVKS